MRRSLAFISVAFILVGLELSTEAISLIVGRLRVGVESILAGTDFHVPAFRFEVGVLALVLGVLLGLVLLWSKRARVEVRAVGHMCPNCGSPTRRIKRRKRHKLLAIVMGENIARRKCETCGWVGLALRG